MAFAIVIAEYLFLPCGQTFGSNTSPQEYEVIAQVRAIIAEALSRGHDHLIAKHKTILEKVQFSPPPSATTIFVWAIADLIYHGVLSPSSISVNTPHNPFVNNTLMAKIRIFISSTMAASIGHSFLSWVFPMNDIEVWF